MKNSAPKQYPPRPAPPKDSIGNINRTVSKKIPHSVIMIGMVSLFTVAATEMIYPLIPMYIAALGSGAVVLGIIEGVAETTTAMLKLISGIISDKVGKRKPLSVWKKSKKMREMSFFPPNDRFQSTSLSNGFKAGPARSGKWQISNSNDKNRQIKMLQL